MSKTISRFLLLLFSVSMFAQTETEILAEAAALNTDSLKALVESGAINQLDNFGNKKGVWARFYPEGKLQELGEFVVVTKILSKKDSFAQVNPYEEIQIGDWWYFNGNGDLMWRAFINKVEPFDEVYEFQFHYDGALEKGFIKDKELKWHYYNGDLKQHIDYVNGEEFYYKKDGKIQYHNLSIDGVKEKRKFYYQKKPKNLISIVPVNKLHPDLNYVMRQKESKEYFTDTTFAVEFEKPSLTFFGRYGDWIQDSIWIQDHQKSGLVIEDIQIPGYFDVKTDTSLAKDRILLIVGQNARPKPNFFQYEVFDILFENDEKLSLTTETQTWHLHSNDFQEQKFNTIELPLTDNVFYWRENKEALLEIYPYSSIKKATEDKVIKRFPIAGQQTKLDLSELSKGKYLFKITNYTNNTVKFAIVLGKSVEK